MRVTSTEQHGHPALGDSTEPVSKGIKSGQSTPRIDHILT